jgi:hypothetical protein
VSGEPGQRRRRAIKLLFVVVVLQQPAVMILRQRGTELYPALLMPGFFGISQVDGRIPFEDKPKVTIHFADGGSTRVTNEAFVGLHGKGPNTILARSFRLAEPDAESAGATGEVGPMRRWLRRTLPGLAARRRPPLTELPEESHRWALARAAALFPQRPVRRIEIAYVNGTTTPADYWAGARRIERESTTVIEGGEADVRRR